MTPEASAISCTWTTRLGWYPLAQLQELAFDVGRVAPGFLEVVDVLLDLRELGLFAFSRLRLLVEPLQERAQKEEVVDDDEQHYA